MVRLSTCSLVRGNSFPAIKAITLGFNVKTKQERQTGSKTNHSGRTPQNLQGIGYE